MFDYAGQRPLHKCSALLSCASTANSMHPCILMLGASVACSGCRSDGSKERQRIAGHFPIVPPITNANPFVRHAVSVRVPTTMRVTRHGDSLAVSFSTAKTNLMVGDRMITGLKRE